MNQMPPPGLEQQMSNSNSANNINDDSTTSEYNDEMAALTANYMKKLQDLQQYRHFLITTKHFIDLEYFYVDEMDTNFVNGYQQMLQQQNAKDVKQFQVKYLQSKNNKLVDDMNKLKMAYKQGFLQFQQRKNLPQLRQIQNNKELMGNRMNMSGGPNAAANTNLEATHQLKLQQQQQQMQQQQQFQQALNNMNMNPGMILPQQQMMNMNNGNNIDNLINDQLKQQQMAMQPGAMNGMPQQRRNNNNW